MRLAGQVKSGFFPAPPEAIREIWGHLRLPPDPPGDQKYAINILDPCAGEGKALAELRAGLSLSGHEGIPVRAWAVELNATRAERIAENYPQTRLLGPCSLHSANISRRSFGLVYLNPPFDHEFGGGSREELNFLRRAADLLVLGGILAFVLPIDQVFGSATMLEELDTYYEQTEVYLFPDAHRKFKECVVFGKRREKPVPLKVVHEKGILFGRGMRYRWVGSANSLDDVPRLGQMQYDNWTDGHPVELSERSKLDTWTVPYSWEPKQWSKTELTTEEIEVELARSPLHGRLKTRSYAAMERPPMPLNAGHTSLQLLSGLLDGLVLSDPPHVVRGYCEKDERLARVERHTTAAGTSVEKRKYSEQPRPVCRAVWSDGNIRTFTETAAASEASQEEFQVEEGGEPGEDE